MRERYTSKCCRMTRRLSRMLEMRLKRLLRSSTMRCLWLLLRLTASCEQSVALGTLYRIDKKVLCLSHAA